MLCENVHSSFFSLWHLDRNISLPESEFSFPANGFSFPKVQFFCHSFYDSVNFPLYKLINLLFGNSRSAFHNTQQSKKNANSNKETLHCSHVWFSTVKNCNDLIPGLYLSPQASQHSMISYLSHVNTLIILQYNLIDVQCGITLYYPEIIVHIIDFA